jgi:hypothetical protein
MQSLSLLLFRRHEPPRWGLVRDQWGGKHKSEKFSEASDSQLLRENAEDHIGVGVGGRRKKEERKGRNGNLSNFSSPCFTSLLYPYSTFCTEHRFPLNLSLDTCSLYD